MEQKIRRDRNMGDNLRRLRDEYGISQEKLCAELQRCGCDIGRSTYAKYESGSRMLQKVHSECPAFSPQHAAPRLSRNQT